jgi:hypothetical protein
MKDRSRHGSSKQFKIQANANALRAALDFPAAVDPLDRGTLRDLFRRGSVQEMAHAGKDHGHAEAVGGGDHVVVAHRAAGLNHG